MSSFIKGIYLSAEEGKTKIGDFSINRKNAVIVCFPEGYRNDDAKMEMGREMEMAWGGRRRWEAVD
jgi:hypothetical protein